MVPLSPGLRLLAIWDRRHDPEDEPTVPGSFFGCRRTSSFPHVACLDRRHPSLLAQCHGLVLHDELTKPPLDLDRPESYRFCREGRDRCIPYIPGGEVILRALWSLHPGTRSRCAFRSRAPLTVRRKRRRTTLHRTLLPHPTNRSLSTRLKISEFTRLPTIPSRSRISSRLATKRCWNSSGTSTGL